MVSGNADLVRGNACVLIYSFSNLFVKLDGERAAVDDHHCGVFAVFFNNASLCVKTGIYVRCENFLIMTPLEATERRCDIGFIKSNLHIDLNSAAYRGVND